MTMSNQKRHTGDNGAEKSAPSPEARGTEPIQDVPAEVVEEKSPIELLQDEVKAWKDQAARAQAALGLELVFAAGARAPKQSLKMQ